MLLIQPKIRITIRIFLGIFAVNILLCNSILFAAENEAKPVNLELITLPLQFHLVTSQIEHLHAKSAQEDVDRMQERINGVWAAAGIHWSLQKTVTHPVGSEDQIIAAMNGTAQIPREFLLNALIASETSSKVWNMFIVHDLTSIMGFPGVYLPSRQSLIISELDPAGLNDPGRIAAHELGHSLTLAHVECVSKGNLMSAGCASVNRTRLEPEQIEDVRRQAGRGEPVSN